ncbi:MAG: hypothetical protein QXU26_04200 [Thermofilaceae archaeon]
MPIQVGIQLATVARKAVRLTDELVFRVEGGKVRVYAIHPSFLAAVAFNAGDAIGEEEGNTFAVRAKHVASAEGLRYDIDVEQDRLFVKYVTKKGAEVEKYLPMYTVTYDVGFIAELASRQYAEVPVVVSVLESALDELEAEDIEPVSLVVDGDTMTLSVASVAGQTKVRVKLGSPAPRKLEALLQYDILRDVVEVMSVHDHEVLFGMDEAGVVRFRGKSGLAEAYVAQVKSE